jgi:hypothetical protein
MDNVAFNSMISDAEFGYSMLDTIDTNETGPSPNCTVAILEPPLKLPWRIR